jgi:hypothetical protein
MSLSLAYTSTLAYCVTELIISKNRFIMQGFNGFQWANALACKGPLSVTKKNKKNLLCADHLVEVLVQLRHGRVDSRKRIPLCRPSQRGSSVGKTVPLLGLLTLGAMTRPNGTLELSIITFS